MHAPPSSATESVSESSACGRIYADHANLKTLLALYRLFSGPIRAYRHKSAANKFFELPRLEVLNDCPALFLGE